MSDLEMCKVLMARWVRLLSELADAAEALGGKRSKLSAEQLVELHAWIAATLGQPATCDSADSGHDDSSDALRYALGLPADGPLHGWKW